MDACVHFQEIRIMASLLPFLLFAFTTTLLNHIALDPAQEQAP